MDGFDRCESDPSPSAAQPAVPEHRSPDPAWLPAVPRKERAETQCPLQKALIGDIGQHDQPMPAPIEHDLKPAQSVVSLKRCRRCLSVIEVGFGLNAQL